MDLTFDMRAVRQWADFSGDFNPIHFDIAHARIAGLNALIVHGMLALIPIKQALTQSHAANNPGYAKWMKFRAAFRNPIAHDSVNTLATRQTSRGVNFQLSNTDIGAERLRGTYGAADDTVIDTVKGVQITHLSALDNAQLQHFTESYPAVSESWIALDAVVFSDFMRTKLDVISDIARTQLNDVSGSRVVVQTSHTVFADLAALPGTHPAMETEEWGQMSYAMLPPVMVVNAGQVSGSVSLPVYRNEQFVMLVEIGLLAKVSTDLPTQ